MSYFFILTNVICPISEEILFRGFIQKNLLKEGSRLLLHGYKTDLYLIRYST